jgi:hypothetical protein
MHKKNIMQGQTHQQYHLKINIFLFLKINCICIKHTKKKDSKWISITPWKKTHLKIQY